MVTSLSRNTADDFFYNHGCHSIHLLAYDIMLESLVRVRDHDTPDESKGYIYV
jgi:hypothetical protein